MSGQQLRRAGEWPVPVTRSGCSLRTEATRNFNRGVDKFVNLSDKKITKTVDRTDVGRDEMTRTIMGNSQRAGESREPGGHFRVPRHPSPGLSSPPRVPASASQ